MMRRLCWLVIVCPVLIFSFRVTAQPPLTDAKNAAAQSNAPRTDLFGDPVPSDVIHLFAVPPMRHSGRVEALVVVPGTKQCITASREGAIHWDLATCKRLKTLTEDDVRCLTLAPQGDLVASSSVEGQIAIHELASGNKRVAFKGHQSYACGMAFSPDGSVLATAREAEIRLWKTSTGEAVGMLAGHTRDVLDVAFRPDGKALFSVGADGTLREWDLATSKESRRLTEVPGWYALTLALSADGKTLGVVAATGNGPDGQTQVRLLDAGTLQERFRAVLPGTLPYAVALSPDGRHVATGLSLASAEDGCLRLWDSWTCKQVALQPRDERKVNTVRFLAGGKTLASAGDDGMVHLWNVADGVEQVFTMPAIGPVSVLAFSPTGDVLASGGKDGTVRLWDSGKGVFSHLLRHHDEMPIRALVFSADGEYVLATAAARQGFADLWRVRTGEYLRTIQPALGQAAFSPDGKTLAAPDNENNIGLWDVATGTDRGRLRGHGGPVHASAFSPDGHVLASASADRTLRLWRVATGNCFKTMPVDSAEMDRLWFSPDGSLLFAGHNHNSDNINTHVRDSIKVFEAATGECVVTVTSPNPTVQGAWLTHGGATLVVGSAPRKFRFIDLVTGNALGPDVAYADDYTTAVFSPDGRALALGNEDGRLVLLKPPLLPARKPLPAEMDEAKLKGLWQALAGADAKLAFQARFLLTAAPKQALALFRAELRPQTGDAEKVAVWIGQLDSNSFKEREVAMKELEKIGDAFEPALRAILAQPPSLEMRMRVELLLTKLAAVSSGERLRSLRAIAILEAVGGDEARAILRSLAEGAETSRITEASQAALKRLK